MTILPEDEGRLWDVVVIGGPRWSDEVNAISVHTVRELTAARHRVLYIYSEVQGSVLRNLASPAQPKERRMAAQVAFGRLQAIQRG